MAITISRTAPPAKPTGVTVTAVHGIDKIYSEESGVLVDRTTEFTTGAGVQFMSSDDDYIYIGLDTKRYTQGVTAIDGRWADVHVALTTPASVDLGLTFEYSNADGNWTALSVTDGTNGFTQDGTIGFVIADYPSLSLWKPKAVEDATARFYIRIKRTTDTVVTPPTINEIGTGLLTANTTYYYEVWGMYSTGYSGGYPLRSVPSAEANGTTTTIKRSLKVEWANDASSERYNIMRTPNSEDYQLNSASSGAINSTADIDNYAQSVNCGYFTYYDVETENRDYTVDNGIPLYARHNSSTAIISYYTMYAYFDKPRGAIVVSGGTELTPATFTDIYNADQLNGWGTFIKNHLDWANYNIWECYDHIDIEDYFADTFVTLYTSGYFSTFDCTSAVFGQEEDTETTLGGLRLIYANSITNNPPLYFQNTIFYNSMINDDSRNDRNLSRIYSHVIFYDNCELYDTAIQNELKIDTMKFDGDNIIADNLRIVNSRYGFEITGDSISTSTITNLKIYGEYGLSTNAWANNLEVTYRDFEMTDVEKPIWNYPGIIGTGYYSTIFNLIDFTFINSDIMDSDIGLNSVINIYNSLLITVKDSDGVAIVGTSVIIKDVNGNNISGSPFITDANGQINPDILMSVYTASGDTPGYSASTYVVDEKEDKYPFTITIAESGYQTYTDVFTHNANEEWEIALQEEPEPEKVYVDRALAATIDTTKIESKVQETTVNSTITLPTISSTVLNPSINSEISVNTIHSEVN